MGKASQGVYGSFSGKVGNVVGKVLQGQQVYSIYQRNVANPRTPAQQAQRRMFTAMSELMSSFIAAIRVGFHQLDGYIRGNAYSAAVGYNLNSGIATDSGTVTTIDYTKLNLSEGKVLLPYSLQCTAEGGSLQLSWADNSGSGDALANDSICVAVLDETTKATFFSKDSAIRSARSAAVDLPTAWGGDDIRVYAFMHRENGECSMTANLGEFTL